jgi:hypothetical protein
MKTPKWLIVWDCNKTIEMACFSELHYEKQVDC